VRGYHALFPDRRQFDIVQGAAINHNTNSNQIYFTHLGPYVGALTLKRKRKRFKGSENKNNTMMMVHGDDDNFKKTQSTKIKRDHTP